MTFDSHSFLKPVSRFASVYFRFAFSLAEVQTFAHLLQKKQLIFYHIYYLYNNFADRDIYRRTANLSLDMEFTFSKVFVAAEMTFNS